MSIKKMTPSALNDWVSSVISKHRVYAPQAAGEHFAYDLLGTAEDLRLDHDATILPPRKYLMPPREPLVQFAEDGHFRSVEACEPFVLFGVHPYDVAAIAQMDRYFSQDKADAHYQARRRSATIVACDVQNPSENVFAACMGTATVSEGFDVLLTLVGETYVVDARTAAGEALLAEAGPLEDADAVSLGRREQAWLDARKSLCRNQLHCSPEDLPALLERSYDHPVWERKSQDCFSCGSCVMVCPSCFCFDVQDETNWDLASGTRLRQWDGCLLTEFASVAGGHNFRRHRVDRYRHRFYRKAKYLPQRCGFTACVGCGRCVGACVAGIANPVEVFNSLLED